MTCKRESTVEKDVIRSTERKKSRGWAQRACVCGGEKMDSGADWQVVEAAEKGRGNRVETKQGSLQIVEASSRVKCGKGCRQEIKV